MRDVSTPDGEGTGSGTSASNRAAASPPDTAGASPARKRAKRPDPGRAEGARTVVHFANLLLSSSVSEGDKNISFASLIGPPHFRETSLDDILSGAVRGYFVVPLLGSQDDVNDVIERLPAPSLELLQRRAAGLIIDNSREGRKYQEERLSAWHQAIRSAGVPASRVCYVTQNRELPQRYADWCAENQVADRVAILNYDYYIKHFISASWGGPGDSKRAFKEKLAQFEARSAIEKKFLCLNFKPRPWRVALLTRLLRDELWDDGLVSFGGLESDIAQSTNNSYIWKKGGPIDHFKKLRISSETVDFVPNLVDKGAIFFDTQGNEEVAFGRQRTHDIKSDIFLRTGFSLVTETEMAPYKLRVTEKPFKALANFHPVILFGNFKALTVLKDLGFQTFSKWIDESYDDIAYPEERFRAAYTAFLDFKERSDDLILNDEEFRAVLIHNARTAMVDLRAHYSANLDAELQATIAASVPIEAEAPPEASETVSVIEKQMRARRKGTQGYKAAQSPAQSPAPALALVPPLQAPPIEAVPTQAHAVETGPGQSDPGEEPSGLPQPASEAAGPGRRSAAVPGWYSSAELLRDGQDEVLAVVFERAASGEPVPSAVRKVTSKANQIASTIRQHLASHPDKKLWLDLLVSSSRSGAVGANPDPETALDSLRNLEGMILKATRPLRQRYVERLFGALLLVCVVALAIFAYTDFFASSGRCTSQITTSISCAEVLAYVLMQSMTVVGLALGVFFIGAAQNRLGSLKALVHFDPKGFSFRTLLLYVWVVASAVQALILLDVLSFGVAGENFETLIEEPALGVLFGLIVALLVELVTNRQTRSLSEEAL